MDTLQTYTHPTGSRRPRKPIGVDIASLPDDSLVDKTIRRAVTGLGDSHTYVLIAEQKFPLPIRLGPRCVRWRMGDLRRWLADPLNWRA
ncbi:MAG: AlpA family phage regulatory protein [Betaproteobacteria bacterium]|nr:AlpA family phage regulatory protein [Betaproteobacteria bacterium]